jgi:periplasmic protein TonB
MTTLMRWFAAGALLLAATLTLAPLRPCLAQDAAEGSRKVLNRVEPQYPATALRLNIQGSVKVEVVIASNGTVKSMEIRGGHPLLAQAAQNAIRQWRWEPYPHETTQSIEIKFRPQSAQ